MSARERSWGGGLGRDYRSVNEDVMGRREDIEVRGHEEQSQLALFVNLKS